MRALFTVTFQGEPSIVGELDAATAQLAAREAFPESPRRDALIDEQYRAFKLSPLRDGKLLVSVVTNRREKDALGRAVLRANGCVLEAADFTGASRDVTAIWTGLSGDLDGFDERVNASSVMTSVEAFERLRNDLRDGAAFYAGAAAALSSERATLHLPPVQELDALRPAFSLLPLSHLLRLRFSTGASEEEPREPVIAVREPDGGAPAEGGGLLSGLLGRSKRAPRVVHVDFAARRIRGLEGTAGPVALVEGITAPSWPNVDDHSRFRSFVASMDAPRPLFEQLPVLEEMRRAVRQAEHVSTALESWR